MSEQPPEDELPPVALEPSTLPEHPLRAMDIPALLPKEIGLAVSAPKGRCPECRMPYAECVCDDDESERSGMGQPITDDEIEQEVQARGLTAPRVTADSIDTAITGQDYHVFPGTTVTVCCLTLRNGYRVIGQSAAASPENFDAELGRMVAYRDARDKIWALEGYLLRERLSRH